MSTSNQVTGVTSTNEVDQGLITAITEQTSMKSGENPSRIDNNLRDLSEEWMETGEANVSQTQAVVSNNHDDSSSSDESETHVMVRIMAVDVEALKLPLEELGLEILGSAPEQHFLEALIPIDAIPQLEASELVGLLGAVSLPQAITSVGSVENQADFLLGTERVRANLPTGFDGTGIKIGALSDSYNNLNGEANDIASGDLPNDVDVLEDLDEGGTDEGRAMLQLIHDLAPEADLSFATAFGGEIGFANNIRALAADGADIIVDDVIYFAEPFFQDGIVAQAVDEVVEDGAAYFSSAGNRGNAAYESTQVDFVQDSSGFGFYDFDPSNGVDIFQRITIPEGRQAIFILQWDDPFYTTDGVDSDVDMFLLDPDGNVVAESIIDNIAFQFPVEGVFFENNTGQTDFDIAITLFSGPAPERLKYVPFGFGFNPADTINQEYATNSPTTWGHSAATGAMAVSAAPFFDPTVPEPFTSEGPTTILFNPDGSRKSTPEIRQTPDITAIDGTDTTFFVSDIPGDGNDDPNFFGTSASAPHAAAVAALVLEANPMFTPEQLYERLESTATDIGEPGYDNVTGFGLINAYEAIFGPVVPAELPFTEDFEDGDLPIAFETFITGAGRIQITEDLQPIGTGQILMDATFDGFFALNELILHIDATDFSNIELSFDQKEFDDEDQVMPLSFTDSVNADGVALSVDGTNWFRLFDLTGDNSTDTFQTNEINLSEFAEDNDLILGSDVQIKFQQFGDGFSSPGIDRGDLDGFAFDNISVTSEGSKDDDLLEGTANDDTINGFKGNDTINGGAGDDLLDGGKDEDTLNGGAGDDTLIGEKANDLLNGDDGNDLLNGGKDEDTLNGGAGDDTLEGEGGDDILDGGEGNDSLDGGDREDTLTGGAGNDSLSGGDNNDILIGVDPTSAQPGLGEVDTLTGDNAGDEDDDLFVLGDENQVYYQGSNEADYGLITDFDQKDMIQLNGAAEDYQLGVSPAGLPNGTAIFLTTGSTDELIGIVQGTSELNLSDDQVFSFI